MQFLEKRYPDMDSRRQYAEKLWAHFPAGEVKPPSLRRPLPSCLEEERASGVPGSDLILILHVATLDFRRGASLKGVVSLKTSLLLVDEILTDGFLSAAEPVLVQSPDVQVEEVWGPWWESQDDPRSLGAFSVNYVKGAARVSTLHTILTLCLDDEVQLMEASVGGSRGMYYNCWWTVLLPMCNHARHTPSCSGR